MPEEKKLTIAQIVERTGAARSTVSRWCRTGRFPNAERVKTPMLEYWLIPESDFLAVEEELNNVKFGRPKKDT